MTVKELIANLGQYPEDSIVEVEWGGTQYPSQYFYTERVSQTYVRIARGG